MYVLLQTKYMKNFDKKKKDIEKIKWTEPKIKKLGNAKDLIKEAKFSGFSDGVTFSGSPIGESS